MKCPINFCTVAIKRKEANDRGQLSGKLGKAINVMIADHMDYLKGYDKVIVYNEAVQTDSFNVFIAISIADQSCY
jgi:hypothetical protein